MVVTRASSVWLSVVPGGPERLADLHPPHWGSSGPGPEQSAPEASQAFQASLPSVYSKPVPSCPHQQPLPELAWLPSPFPTSSWDAPEAKPCSCWCMGSPITFASAFSSPSLSPASATWQPWARWHGEGKGTPGPGPGRGLAQEGVSGPQGPRYLGRGPGPTLTSPVSLSSLLLWLLSIPAESHRQGQLKL